MIKNIVFDFGSVLVDWDRRHYFDKYFAGDLEKENYFLDNVCTLEWNANFDKGLPFKEVCESYAAEHPEWADAILAYGEHWAEMLNGLIPGMPELVSELKAKFKVLYGLTNWSWEKFPYVLEQYKELHQIDNIVCSGLEKEIKPYPRIYHILLDRYGLVPEETLFIDDSPRNIETAKTLGIQTYLFDDAKGLRKFLAEKGIL